jgi:pimeloyl-ACP methyl ester carboxylesterase
MIRKSLKIIGYLLLVLLILFCGLPYLFSVEQRELKADAKPYPNSHFIVVNKTRIHYRVWLPDTIKQKFFFVHGFSGSTFCWRKNIDTLVKNKCLVVAIDLPAFGFSDKGDSADYSLTNVFHVINDVSKSFDTRIKGKWNFVGHSMGAAVAGAYAANFPERIKALTLIDGAPVNTDVTMDYNSVLTKIPPLLRWADVAAKWMANEKTFKGLVKSGYACEPDTEAVHGYLRPFLYEHSGSAILRMAAAQDAVKFDEGNLRKFPVSTIWGDADTWLPITGMRNFLKKFPMASGYIIKGAGHCSMETHPKEINSVLLKQARLSL